MSLPEGFHVDFYKHLNPDLDHLSPSKASSHYKTTGVHENRKWDIQPLLPPNFNPHNYKKLNPDISRLSNSMASVHYLQLGISENRKYLISPPPLPEQNDTRISIIYFIHTHSHPTSYQHLFRSQMEDLKISRILSSTPFPTTLHIVATGTPIESIHSTLQSILESLHFYSRKNNLFSIEIEVHPESDTFEFHGISKVSQLALTHKGSPNHYLLYFHSKGISHKIYSRHQPSNPIGNHLFKHVIRDWERAIILFREREEINKMGLCCSQAGWVWYNFMWLRGSYVVELETPILTKKRRHYEDWAARRVRQRPIPMDSIFRKIDREEILLGSAAYNQAYEVSSGDCLNLHPLAYPPSRFFVPNEMFGTLFKS